VDGFGEVVSLVCVDFHFMRRQRTATGGGGGFGYRRGVQIPVGKDQANASNDAPGIGNRSEAREGRGGGLKSPEFRDFTRNNGRLR
jgi:hypothetical protein